MSDKKITSLVEAKGKDRTYQMEDGSIEKWSGGTVAWRNNNPGNLKFEYSGSADKTVKTNRTMDKALSDAQKKYDGIVALDQWGNAIFENLEAGRAAKIKLLTNRFNDMNVHQMIRKYSVPDYTGNTNWDKQEKVIYDTGDQQGVNIRDKKISDMSEKELSALADGIAKFEGWKKGEVLIIKDRQSSFEDQNYQSKKELSAADQLRYLIDGFKNDTDGSFAKKVLAENVDIVEDFRARQQENQEKKRQQQESTQQEIQPEIQQPERSFGGRSFG